MQKQQDGQQNRNTPRVQKQQDGQQDKYVQKENLPIFTPRNIEPVQAEQIQRTLREKPLEQIDKNESTLKTLRVQNPKLSQRTTPMQRSEDVEQVQEVPSRAPRTPRAAQPSPRTPRTPRASQPSPRAAQPSPRGPRTPRAAQPSPRTLLAAEPSPRGSLARRTPRTSRVVQQSPRIQEDNKKLLNQSQIIIKSPILNSPLLSRNYSQKMNNVSSEKIDTNFMQKSDTFTENIIDDKNHLINITMINPILKISSFDKDFSYEFIYNNNKENKDKIRILLNYKIPDDFISIAVFVNNTESPLYTEYIYLKQEEIIKLQKDIDLVFSNQNLKSIKDKSIKLELTVNLKDIRNSTMLRISVISPTSNINSIRLKNTM